MGRYDAEYAAARAARDTHGEGSPQHWDALAALRAAQGNPVMAEMNRIARDEGAEAMQAEISRRLGFPEGYEPEDDE